MYSHIIKQKVLYPIRIIPINFDSKLNFFLAKALVE